MKHTNFHQLVNDIQNQEKVELYSAIKAHGGSYEWKEDGDEEHPLIAINPDNTCAPEPTDINVTKVWIENGELKLRGYDNSNGHVIEFGPDEPFAGHLSDIIDYIPEVNGVNDVTIEEPQTRTPANIVSSFFFYMWNAWCEEEAKIAFPENSRHLWQKWCEYNTMCGKNASEKFYKELDEYHRHLLVERACQVYNGKSRN